MLFFAGGEAFRTGTHKSMILEYLRIKNELDLKVHYYGHTRSWSQRGSALSSLIAGAIVFTTSSYPFVFLFSIIPYLFLLVLMFTYPSYLDFTSGKRETISIKEKVIVSFSGFINVLSNPVSRKTLINSGLYDGIFKSVKDYIQPVLKTIIVMIPVLSAVTVQKRLAILTAGVYFILYMLTSLVSAYSGKGIEAFHSEVRGLNVTYLTAVLFMLVIGISLFCGSYVFAVVFFILFYMLQNFRRPVMTGYLSGKILPEVMATGLSIESQGKTIITAILAPLCGFIVDRFGLYAALAALAFLLLIFYPLLSLHEKKSGRITRR